ncbi:MAG: GYDIA family GHMP kinase [Gillisia sp.]
MSQEYRSHGKLLLTGEYVVLDGAMALTLPTKFGQSLEVTENEKNEILWEALDHQGNVWIETTFAFNQGKITDLISFKGAKNHADALKTILTEAFKLSEGINSNGFKVKTALEFPSDWGLGSSSTLINNIAQWLKIDAFLLLENTFGGSGFDIAAAQNDNPVTYQFSGGTRSILKTTFHPRFADDLFFVHLNQKQNSRNSISHYKAQPQDILQSSVEKISGLTESFISCDNLEEFKLLIEIHENIISKLVNLPKIKTRLFPDFSGAIKSLGGWGGDFILATGKDMEKEYFRKKGYSTILSFSEMIL